MNLNGEEAQNDNHHDEIEKSLLDFDDLVLAKIMTHLNVMDLTNLGETCMRLEKLTQEHSAKYHTSVSLIKNHNTSISNSHEMERVFKHIGKHVKILKLGLWAHLEVYDILVIVAQQCIRMETLILEALRLSSPLALSDPLINDMFRKLKRFVLCGCHWVGWCPIDIFFGDNSTLEELSIINCGAYHGTNYRMQLDGFRSLQNLRVSRCRNVVTEHELALCFKSNNIRTLVLNDIGYVNIFFDNVIDGLYNTLEEICFEYVIEMNLDQISRLKKLKIVRLHCEVSTAVDKLLLTLSEANEIEELVLSQILISSKTMDAMKNFKKLERLKIDRCVNSIPRQFFRNLPKILPQLSQFVYARSSIRDEDVIYFVKFMTKLKSLSFIGCNSLATKTYLEMVRILAEDWQRPKPLEFRPPTLPTSAILDAIKGGRNHIHLRTD